MSKRECWMYQPVGACNLTPGNNPRGRIGSLMANDEGEPQGEGAVAACAIVRLPPTLGVMSSVPTQPGWYWFQRDAKSRAIMLEVRMTKGTGRSTVVNLNGPCHSPSPLSGSAVYPPLPDIPPSVYAAL